MKIIYLHQYFTTPDMVGGTRSFEMARRLVAWGHEVHLITSWRRESVRTTWFEETIEGIHVHWLPVAYDNSMGFWKRIWAFSSFALRAGFRATYIGGDVVFATSTPLTIALPGALAARRLGVPMVFEVRDLWPEVPIAMGFLRHPLAKAAARWLEHFAYMSSRHVVALSQGMADGVAQMGYPRSRISVIPNSADIELFTYSEVGAQRFHSDRPELGNGPIVLYPGTIGQANGVSYLPRLAKGMLARRPDVRFVVIGEGAELELVRQTARKLGVLGVNFFQYDALPKRVLVDAFSAATVVISLFIDEPALRANSANKFFDALASGTAVAINYQGWQADLLMDVGAGVVLPADPVEAVEPMLSFLSSAVQLSQCAEAAKRLAQERFDRDVLARQLENTLLDAVTR